MEYIASTLNNLIHQTAFFNLTWGNYVMILVACFFLYLAIRHEFEPLLLLPIAFGMLLVNIYPDIMLHPENAANGAGGLLYYFYKLDELAILPSLIFMGVGAMTDFGPLIANPKSFLLGAAAQFGIFAAYFGAIWLGFNDKAAAAISIIGGADGPTSIFLAGKLGQTALLGPIAVAAYSYMSLVPIIQPPIMKLLTTEKERKIKMGQLRPVSKLEKILFPIIITAVCGITEPVLFGVTMKIRTNMIAAMAGGGVGGFFMGLMNTKNYSGGSPGLLTLPSYIGLDTPMANFYYACAGAAIAFVVAFIVSFVLFRDEKKN